MPNLVSPPAASPLTSDQLAAAQALVASALGVASIERQEGVGESGMVGSSGRIALRRPAVSIQSLTLGGAPAIGILRPPWVVDVSSLFQASYGNPWGSGPISTPYTVVYTAGWTAGDLPEGLRQAILQVAAGLAAQEGREGVTSEQMGPVKYTYSDTASTGTLPADALALLRPWLPLRF